MATADATRSGPRPRLGPYTLLDRVGEGGMGVVHRAVGPDGQTVALKALRPHLAGDATGRARLASEVRVLRRVVGPHVAEVLDADVDADPPYVVTRFIDGPPLNAVVLETGPLTGGALRRLARGLAAGLCDVHAAGVVHRDLKPGNVLLVRGEPVVIDFGIARVADDQRLTVTGLLIGTPGYLAPEIVDGADATPASDVHAWGATIAFAATGRPPYGRGPMEVVLYRVLQGEPDLDGVPEGLAGILRLAMARDPASRPSAADLLGLLRRDPALSPPTLPVPPAALPVQPTRDRPTRGLSDPPTRTLSIPSGGETGPWSPSPPPVPYAEPRQPRRRRRPLLALLLLANVVAGAVLAPIIVAAGLSVLLVLLRAADRSVTALNRRREVRGPRPVDGIRAVAAFPWQLLRSLVTTVFLLPLPMIVAAGTVVAAVVWAGVPSPGGRAPALLAAAAVGVAAVVAWGGPGGSPARRSTWRLLNALAPRRLAAALWVVALLAVLAGLVQTAGTTGTVWWPLDSQLVERVVTQLP